MSKKCALLLSGTLKTFRHSFHDLIERLVIPSNADVFIYMKPHSEWYDRENTTILDTNHEETDQFIRQGLGSYLKGLEWVDVCPDTEQLLDNAQNLLHSSWLYQYGQEVIESLEHYSRAAMSKNVDQYCRLRRCARMMKEYADQHDITYDAVFRARIDVYPELVIPWHLCELSPGEVRFHDSIPEEVRDFLFIADQNTMYTLCEEYPNRYLCYHSPSATIASKAMFTSKTMLSPEYQLAQMVKHDPRFIPTFMEVCLHNEHVPKFDGAMMWVMRGNIYPTASPLFKEKANEISCNVAVSTTTNNVYFILFVILAILFALVHARSVMSGSLDKVSSQRAESTIRNDKRTQRDFINSL